MQISAVFFYSVRVISGIYPLAALSFVTSDSLCMNMIQPLLKIFKLKSASFQRFCFFVDNYFYM